MRSGAGRHDGPRNYSLGCCEDALLHGVDGHEPDDAHLVLLADAMRAVLRLQVLVRVPVRVEDHHRVRRLMIHAEKGARVRSDGGKRRWYGTVVNRHVLALESKVRHADTRISICQKSGLENSEHCALPPYTPEACSPLEVMAGIKHFTIA